ncbi:MAG: GntR family transcriptional regulator [Spirochaetes bacterium]|nr:GntR family transcriptional regulator [Spirochaetota bacterium]MBU1082322.1 GntR family transcriptional regulator [Spirochaetota bacterium]
MVDDTSDGKRPTIADRIAFQLERLVLDGELKPGDRLPPERELAERFGASRNGIREAIRRLETLGLLSTEPQSGTYVREYLEEASFDLLLYLMESDETLDPALLIDLLEYRKMLMTTAAGLAAIRDPRGCSRDLAALAAELGSTTDASLAAALDYRYHSRIVSGSGNLLFRSLHTTSRSLHLYYTKRFYAEPGTIAATAAQQEAIAEAIGAGDSAGAARAMSEALDYGRRVIEAALSANRP